MNFEEVLYAIPTIMELAGVVVLIGRLSGNADQAVYSSIRGLVPLVDR